MAMLSRARGRSDALQFGTPLSEKTAVSEKSDADGQDSMVAVFVQDLQARFGDRAVDVADAQCKRATDQSLATWTLILARLRLERGHPAAP